MTTVQTFALAFASAVAAIAVLLAWFTDDAIRRRLYNLGVGSTAVSMTVFAGLLWTMMQQPESRIVTVPGEPTVIIHDAKLTPELGAAIFEAVQSRYLQRTTEAVNGVRNGVHGEDRGGTDLDGLAGAEGPNARYP